MLWVSRMNQFSVSSDFPHGKRPCPEKHACPEEHSNRSAKPSKLVAQSLWSWANCINTTEKHEDPFLASKDMDPLGKQQSYYEPPEKPFYKNKSENLIGFKNIIGCKEISVYCRTLIEVINILMKWSIFILSDWYIISMKWLICIDDVIEWSWDSHYFYGRGQADPAWSGHMYMVYEVNIFSMSTSKVGSPICLKRSSFELFCQILLE